MPAVWPQGESRLVRLEAAVAPVAAGSPTCACEGSVRLGGLKLVKLVGLVGLARLVGLVSLLRLMVGLVGFKEMCYVICVG